MRRPEEIRAELHKSRQRLDLTRAALEILADVYPMRDERDLLIVSLQDCVAEAADADWGPDTIVQFKGRIVVIESIDGRKFMFDLVSRMQTESAA